MISVIIPAHNEEENIENALKRNISICKKHFKNDFEIIVVNDNSSDNTKYVVKNLSDKNKEIKLVERFYSPGMGNALKEGTKISKGDIIIWTMADLSDDVTAFPKFVEKINEGYDMVFASRHIEGGSYGDIGKDKAFFSSFYSRVARLIFGMNVNDITNAFRCFRKHTFDSLNIESGDFAISPEFSIKAHKAGFKMTEVPVIYSNRKAGKTKFKMLKMGLRYASLFKYKI